MRRVVAVSPAPADAVVGCGATLAGLAAGGWDVTLLTVFGPAEDEAAATLGLTRAAGLSLASGDAAFVVAALGPALDGLHADRIFAPLAPGPVDEALRWLNHPAPVVRWRALDEPRSTPLPHERGIPAAALLDRKLAACPPHLREPVRALAATEARRLGVEGFAEALVEPPPDPRRERAARAEAEREEKVALARLRAQMSG